jgi:hypothetical protein
MVTLVAWVCILIVFNRLGLHGNLRFYALSIAGGGKLRK